MFPVKLCVYMLAASILLCSILLNISRFCTKLCRKYDLPDVFWFVFAFLYVFPSVGGFCLLTQYFFSLGFFG